MTDPMTNNIEVLRRLRERLVRINRDTDGDNHINESCDALDELDTALAAMGGQGEVIAADSVDGELSVEQAINDLCEMHPGADRLAMKLLAALFTHKTVVRYRATPTPHQPEAQTDEEGRAITAVEVMLFGRACYLPADIAQEVEQACVAREQEQSHEGQ